MMGHEAIVSNDYGKAEMIYHGVISVTVCQPLKVDALIGAFIARYKKEKKSLSWLKTCIKDINLPLSEHPWLPFEVSIHILFFRYLGSRYCASLMNINSCVNLLGVLCLTLWSPISLFRNIKFLIFNWKDNKAILIVDK